MSDNTNVTTAGSGAATMVDLQFKPSPERPVGMRGLFDVEVFGPEEFVLIPKCELAKSLCHMWLHMQPSTSLAYRGFPGSLRNGFTMHLWSNEVESLSLRFKSSPHITKPDHNGDPLGHERTISLEEYEVALKAIEAHRAAKTKPAPKRLSRKAAVRKTR